MACFLLGVAVIGFDSDAAADPQGVEFFEREIRPLLVEHCLECHASTGKRKGGLALDSREGWRAGGDTGMVITPGDPEKSLLIEAVRYHNREMQMPPDNRLADREVRALETWVRLGAPDPRDGGAKVEVVRGLSEEEGRAFWAFRPIDSPAVPVVADPGWVKNPVDAFIARSLEAKGLTPAPGADRASLLRRVTFDLTGLPPEPEEVERFLADDSPDAWDRAVERLLASPQYGVRWGRHWLDVVRYADSNGLDENLGFGHAWRYRDYVIDSFNSGRPFDRFVVEQLAGDLLPGATPVQRTATGFLALGARVLAEPDEEKLRMDVIDEQLDTLGKAFLGMTFGCARCHDHKFDPITQRDYYGLAAIFKSSENFDSSRTGAIKHWYEHTLASADEVARAKADDALIAKAREKFTSFKSKAVSELQAASRARVVEYLVAAVSMAPEATLAQAEPLCAEKGLHPWILLQCRLHLSYHPDDPVLGAWHPLAAKGDREGIRRHFGPLFAAAEAAWQAARKADPKVAKLADEKLDAARRTLNDSEGLLALPTEPFKAFDDATVRELARLDEEARRLESSAFDAPAAMGVGEASKVVAQMPIHIRGNHLAHGAMVSRAVPAVMRGASGEPQWKPDRSGRLELAQWLTAPDHPLTARLIVNRIWRWHFGTGLVATPDNFGVKGEIPSHPELLDWLARRFIESGWDVKAMHRLLLASNTYQMATVHPQPGAAPVLDPENRLHWRFQRQRLEAEQIRDAVLFVAGRLDDTLGGKTLPLRNRQMVFNHTSKDHTQYEDRRRSVYLPVIRNHVADVLAQFDYPDPTMPTGSRNSTVVAPQCLYLMNAPLVIDAARAMASASLRAGDAPQERIAWIYRRALSRGPKDKEVAEALRWLGGNGDETAWAMLCQAVMASNEFVYLP
jgi:mono/diheme cytochrome c family protein